MSLGFLPCAWWRRHHRVLASLLLLASFFSTKATAFQFQLGEVDGGLDTTLTLGVSTRLSDPDRKFYGTSNGGLQDSVNADDGNLNYLSGINSLIVKGTSDLELSYGRFKAFGRVYYFYDFENENGDRARTQLSPEALDQVGSDIRLLDLFVVGQFDIGTAPLDIRLGSQVLSWGESTFIQNGINVINPIEVSNIRVPGAELKEALLPVPMISVSYGITEDITLEAFYQFKWQETIIDPPGTYFSTNDFVGRSGSQVFLGFGAIPDSSPLGAVPRGPDQYPSDSGQWGLAARVFVPGLNSTEFGFYFINYHSRLPNISAVTPTEPINPNLTEPLTLVFSKAGLPPEQASAAASQLFGILAKYTIGGPGALTPQELAILQAPQSQAAIDGAKSIAFLTSAATANYLIEYGEDIQLYGASFNTSVGTSGVSLQGEVSYKVGVPLQVDDIELLFAALSAIHPAFGANNQIGNYLGQLNTYIPGYREENVWQAQTTATKVFGPTLGASQWLLLGEIGVNYVPGLPSKEELRFDGSGTFTSGSQEAMDNTGNGQFAATPAEAFADATSWGYRIVTRLDYDNAFFGANISPLLAFAHDVSGNTPRPLGNFIEGRMSLSAALQFTYLNDWQVELRYTNYFGADAYNLIADRDFLSATLKYSF